MHPATIKAVLEMKHLKQVDVARRGNVSTSVVHDVIHGRSKSKRIEKLISSLTHIPLHDLWPRRYPQPPSQAAARNQSESTSGFPIMTICPISLLIKAFGS